MVRVSKNLRVATVLLCAAVAGCSSDDKKEPGEDSSGAANASLLRFSPMYSAYDGGAHDYKLPAYVDECFINWTTACPTGSDVNFNGTDPVDPKSVKWTVDDKFVARDDYPELSAAILLTTKKAGTTSVSVTATTMLGKKLKQTAMLQITDASAAEWDVGAARYDNMVAIDLASIVPMGGGIPMGGTMPNISAVTDLIPKNASCGNCHNNMAGSITIEHTPQQTAGYSDESLIQIFTTGVKPQPEATAEGATANPFHSDIFNRLWMLSPDLAKTIYAGLHTWDISPDVERGIVFKLRSITPKPQPAVDPTQIINQFRGMGMAAGAAGAEAPADTAGAAGSGT